jgi:hypothetical protein
VVECAATQGVLPAAKMSQVVAETTGALTRRARGRSSSAIISAPSSCALLMLMRLMRPGRAAMAARRARGGAAAAADDGCDGAPIEAARARPRPGLMCQELWGAGAPL